MKRNLKSLGLAFVAVFAMSAMAATAAQAQTHDNAQLTLGAGSGVMKGTQVTEHVFNRGNNVTCANADFTANVTNGATTITVGAVYSQCHARGPFGETWPATVTMNSCGYTFHLFGETKTEPVHGHTFTATAGVHCDDEGDSITVDIYTNHTNHTADSRLCTIHVPEQENLTTVDLTNKPAGSITPENWVEAHLDIGGITSERTGSFLCGGVHDENGTLTGTAALKAENENEEAIGATISTHEEA